MHDSVSFLASDFDSFLNSSSVSFSMNWQIISYMRKHNSNVYVIPSRVTNKDNCSDYLRQTVHTSNLPNYDLDSMQAGISRSESACAHDELVAPTGDYAL